MRRGTVYERCPDGMIKIHHKISLAERTRFYNFKQEKEMQDKKNDSGFKNHKEMWDALEAGKTIQHRKHGKEIRLIEGVCIVTNPRSAIGPYRVGLPADHNDWCVKEEPKKPRKVLAYERVRDIRPMYEGTKLKFHARGIAVRGIGQTVFTLEGSEDHRTLAAIAEFERAPDLDPVQHKHSGEV